MDVILHIGLEKTATSSTQNWFAKNREALAEQGIVYSRVLGGINHRRLCLWALDADREDQGFLYSGIRTAEDRAQFRKMLARDFIVEARVARAAGCRAMVISNEHLSARLRSVHEVMRVRDFLAPHADRIDVICSVRPQVDMAISHASTVSRDRWRLTMAYFDQVQPQNPYYAFGEILNRWAGVFGREQLSVLSYRDCPTVAAYLTGSLRIEGLPAVPRINEALDIRTIAMVNALQIPIFDQTGRQSAFAELFLDRLPVEERLSLGRDTAQAIQARFDAANAELLQQFPEIPASALTPDWAAHDRPSNTGLLTAECAFSDQMAALIRVLNEERVLERLQTRLARAERALARGNSGNAASFLQEAETLAQAVGTARHLGSAAAEAAHHLKVLQQRIKDRDRTRRAGILAQIFGRRGRA